MVTKLKIFVFKLVTNLHHAALLADAEVEFVQIQWLLADRGHRCDGCPPIV